MAANITQRNVFCQQRYSLNEMDSILEAGCKPRVAEVCEGHKLFAGK